MQEIKCVEIDIGQAKLLPLGILKTSICLGSYPDVMIKEVGCTHPREANVSRDGLKFPELAIVELAR